ncbi:unnamed protein product [Hermetia illucens]|uniref:Uncharacterized protein n=1 Tax=Hermetia illucens TaxID=343691 RepID=A0A7R8V0E3_HERIL|nr:unnamed protein product [Hermetia illucens]
MGFIEFPPLESIRNGTQQANKTGTTPQIRLSPTHGAGPHILHPLRKQFRKIRVLALNVKREASAGKDLVEELMALWYLGKYQCKWRCSGLF